MEGALGERLKQDYGLLPHPNVALAIHVPALRSSSWIWPPFKSLVAAAGPMAATFDRLPKGSNLADCRKKTMTCPTH